MRIDRFEDLICWQRARELERRVFAFTNKLPASRDFDFCRQIKNSSSSASRNISEGFGRFWPGEFSHKLHIAVGELRETIDHLEKALEERYIKDSDHLELFGLADAAIRAAVKFIEYLDAAGPDWKKEFLRRRREAYREERRRRTADPSGKIGPTAPKGELEPEREQEREPKREPEPNANENPNSNENPNPNENQNPNENPNPHENENENENPEP
jgi:four helix bundle protein